MNTTCDITLTADVSASRLVARVPAQTQGDPLDCNPEEPAHAEDLRVLLRVPARLIGSPDAAGIVAVNITSLLAKSELTMAEDTLLEDAGL